jgi:hypothetical protein
MRVRVMAGVLAALAFGAGSALAAPQPTFTAVANGCGPGLTLLAGPTHRSCVHATEDTMDARAQARWLGTQPATAPPVCYGDGQSGSRVQLIYGYVAGQKNRSTSVVPTIRKAFAPRMQAMVKAASGGRDLGIRFAFGTGCNGLSVPTVAFPASVVSSADARMQFEKMIPRLQALGYDRSDRKYEVIWDRWNQGGICGLGELLADQDTPQPANVHNGFPLLPSTVSSLQPKYSAVWKNAYGPKGVDCWELGQSKAEVEVHELFHTLGAVQLSAPHSDGAGHCTDTPSVMCPARGVAPTETQCADTAVEVLDCGMDDYWNPAPATGSYLATHDNVADSTYFGPQPQDRLPGS